MYICETYLDSSLTANDENFVIHGYNLARCDHPTDSKREGVCIYSLPLKIIHAHYLQKYINFYLIIGDTLCQLIAPYRSPNKPHDEFNLFIKT